MSNGDKVLSYLVTVYWFKIVFVCVKRNMLFWNVFICRIKHFKRKLLGHAALLFLKKIIYIISSENTMV